MIEVMLSLFEPLANSLEVEPSTKVMLSLFEPLDEVSFLEVEHSIEVVFLPFESLAEVSSLEVEPLARIVLPLHKVDFLPLKSGIDFYR